MASTSEDLADQAEALLREKLADAMGDPQAEREARVDALADVMTATGITGRVPGATPDDVRIAAEVMLDVAAEVRGEKRRRLVTGGDPDAVVEPPKPDAFIDADGFAVESLPWPLLDRIVAALISERSDLEWLGHLVKIATACKAEGPDLASVEVVKWQANHFARQVPHQTGAHILVWVAADFIRDHQVTAYRLERALYAQLTRVERSAKGKLSVGAAGIPVNLRALAAYGTDPGSEERMAVRYVRQLDLAEAPAR